MQPRRHRSGAAAELDQDVGGVVVADREHHVQQVVHGDRRTRREVGVDRPAHARIDVFHLQHDRLLQVELAFVHQTEDVHGHRHLDGAGHRKADLRIHRGRAAAVQIEHVHADLSVERRGDAIQFRLQAGSRFAVCECWCGHGRRAHGQCQRGKQHPARQAAPLARMRGNRGMGCRHRGTPDRVGEMKGRNRHRALHRTLMLRHKTQATRCLRNGQPAGLVTACLQRPWLAEARRRDAAIPAPVPAARPRRCRDGRTRYAHGTAS